MSTPLGIGVLGLGGIACTHHLPALRRIQAVSVVALSDPDPRARERAARLAPGAGRHASAESLLARQDVDAVLIAAPTHLHAELAGAAAAAGKHIYIEKPLATSGTEASRIIDAASRSGVRVAVGFNRRRHPLYVQARGVLAAEVIGRVRSVQSAFSEPVAPEEMPGWKRSRSTGGGVLLDLGSHHFDLIRWFLDSEVEPLAARPDPSDPSRTRPGSTSRPRAGQRATCCSRSWARTPTRSSSSATGASFESTGIGERSAFGFVAATATGFGRRGSSVRRACSLEPPAPRRPRGRAVLRADAARLRGVPDRGCRRGGTVARGRGQSLEAVLEAERLAGASVRAEGR